MRSEINSNQYEILFRLKISLRCSVSFLLVFLLETETRMDFISVILTKMKFQTGMRLSCIKNIAKAKWTSADSLDIAFTAQVHLKLIASVISLQSFWLQWNFTSVDKVLCKDYLKSVYKKPLVKDVMVKKSQYCIMC